MSADKTARDAGADNDLAPPDFTEGMKLYHETFKQLTTLTTGSILLVAAFLNTLFDNPQSRWLITAAFLCFIVSTLASVLLMVLFADELRGSGPYIALPPSSLIRRAYLRSHRAAVVVFRVVVMATSIITFVAGIAALATFAAINFQ
jgi:hypothetical protein